MRSVRADEDAIRAWARTHAAGVRAGGTLAPHAATAPEPVTEPVPVVLSSFTQTRVIATEGWTNAVAWAHHPDGRLLLASGGLQGPVQIWDYGTGQLADTHTWVTDSDRTVRALAWGQRADGHPQLAVTRSDGAVTVWDPGTGEVVVVRPGLSLGSAERANTAVWGRQPDGQLLFIPETGADSGVLSWNSSTGQTVRRHGVPLPAAGAGGQLMATVLGDGAVEIWDTATGRVLETLTGHSHQVNCVAWAERADGRPLLATASEDGVVRVWAHDTDRFTTTLLEPGAGGIDAVAWALTGGRLLLAAITQSAVHLWDGHTLEFLRADALARPTGGYHGLDWTVTPDGELLLAIASRDGSVHVWEAVLDPPVRRPAQADRPAVSRQRRPMRLLDRPEEVTPRFLGADEIEGRTSNLSCTTTPDGQLLLAASIQPDAVHLWDLETGRRLRTLTGFALDTAWWRQTPDGHPLLASGSGDDSTARIWDPLTGQVLQTLTEHSDEINVVAWGSLPDGSTVLATGSDDDTVRIWDPSTGRTLQTLAGHGGIVYALAWGTLPDGSAALVTGSSDRTARIWDPATGQVLQTLGHDEGIDAVAWGTLPDGSTVLATGCRDGTVRIWDPVTGQVLRTLTEPNGNVYAVAWEQAGDGRPLLATAGNHGTVRIWDPWTGTELASVPGSGSQWRSVAWVRDRDQNLLLVVANPDRGAGPARVWLVATGAGDDTGSSPAGKLERHQAGDLTRQLIRLGHGGLWVPLGLLADLVTLTGPDGPGPGADAGGLGLCDARLAVLGGETGIGQLRSLAAGQPGWAREARAAFAALLAAGLDIPARYAPPPEADPAVLAQALRTALADSGTPSTPGDTGSWQVPVTGLRTAAAAITGQAIALLAILGPHACAADPLLPVRLAHRIPQLPALTPRDLRLLTAAGTRAQATAITTAGTLAYSPGTAGVARAGPPTRLLPTQLALPRDLMTMRLAENQLLYRQHRAPTPPSPDPVTIVLDTTPPTFGPAGTTLRMAAHLVTTTLWEHGRYPVLITLASPHTATDLRTPADLLTIWAGSTLRDPAPALAAAIATATATGQPVLLLTHHCTARDHGYRPGPSARLLTSHQPPEDPPPVPVSPWHCQLPPNPTGALLHHAITRLLAGHAADGN